MAQEKQGRPEAAGQTCHHHDHHHADQELAAAIDPVCGMKVKREPARHRFEYRGQEYLFCSARCRERFQADPENFLQPKEFPSRSRPRPSARSPR